MRGKILIVDDCGVNRKTLESILQKDYIVQTADNGHDALTLTQNYKPDVALLDIMMNDINGFQLCHQFRADPTLKSTKIIFISGACVDIDARLKAYQIGADDFVCKPFDKGELLAKVAVFMRLKTAEEVSQFSSDVLSLLYREMQSPLSGITGPAKLLKKTDNLTPEQKEHLDTIQKSVQRLSFLCEKTQALGNLTSGDYVGRATPCAVQGIIQQCVNKIAMHAVSEGVEVIEQFATAAKAAADCFDLGTVIDILLENAVRFSAPGTQVKIHLFEHSNNVCIAVTDQGEGIPKDVLANLFDVFCNTDIRHQGRGMHLRLPMAYHLLKLYGGVIYAQSEEGKGTTMTISLPMAVDTDIEVDEQLVSSEAKLW